MTSNTLLSKLKTKFILALIIVGLLCTSLFFLTACDEDKKTEIPSYSYNDTDDGLISNPDFNYNTSGIALKNYPQTSPTGWSRAKDSEGFSSSAKSGVIDVSEEGWKELLNAIYSDSYYIKYLEDVIGFSKSDIEKENESLSADERKAKVVEKFSSILVSPKTVEGATDNKVYMLNNYTSNLGIGASQKITSSKSITIEKGEYVKISVDVLTQVLNLGEGKTAGLTGGDNEYGASIRLVNTFNGESKSDYAITNIDTNGQWKTYTLYAKGDSEFDCSVTLALGLGYSNLYPTQGTVYFDNVKVEKVKTIPTVATETFSYENEKAIIVNAGATTDFCYDMTFTNPDYNESVTPTLTESAKGGVEQNYSATFDNISKIELKDAYYSLKVESDKFTVENEGYAYLSFKLNNKLNKLSSTSITVDVYENTAGLEEKKMPTIVTVSETGETTVGVMIKNNFDKDHVPAYPTRTFYLVINVGSATAEKLSDFTNGTVEITDFKLAKGATYQYEDDGTETDNYKFYSLFNGVADGSTSLYAGQVADFTVTDDTTVSTGFNIAATYKEYLTKQLLAPSEYDGVVSNHIYLTNNENAESNINTRLTGSNGSYAGVIDTKYAYTSENYDIPKDTPKLEEDIRPLMIYNANADSYGFISNASANVVSANSYAKVSVMVRVDGNAKAYVYLVDTSSEEKSVLTFDAFTPNTNGLSAIPSSEQTQTSSQNLMFEVADTKGEWVEVTFYIATGTTEKSFRVELWNGSRDGQNKSKGYVFFKSVNVSTSGAFTEPSSFKDSFTTSSSPLNGKESELDGKYLCYSRPLTDTERKFNEEHPDQAVSYSAKIVWAKNDTILYAVYNTLDVEEVDPYTTLVEDETDSGSGCTAQTDPATFWLSLSSIVLAVVLVLAIITLFVKNIRRRRKAHASDAKSHYTVKSRVRKAPKSKPEKKEEVSEESIEQSEEEIIEETEEVEEIIEDTEEENKEQTLDDYVYGDVQDFGEEENKEN